MIIVKCPECYSKDIIFDNIDSFHCKNCDWFFESPWADFEEMEERKDEQR